MFHGVHFPSVIISMQRYGRKLTRYRRGGILRECCSVHWLREQLSP